MINFLYEGKKAIEVCVEGLPSTKIKCDEASNEAVLKVCQDWIKALGLEDREWHVDVRLR